MKELLLADANRLSASLSEYEAARQQRARVEYKTFTLREADFNDNKICNICHILKPMNDKPFLKSRS